jgi:predicted 3-demethylubiquinone-9 3-methyltransferase (glyoxalase superfamily)
MDALTTCLWFDTEGEEAAHFYTGDLSRIPAWDSGDPVRSR